MKLALAIVCAIVVISNHGTLGTSMPYRPHCDFRCPDNYRPVCYDGITFDNDCQARQYACHYKNRFSPISIVPTPGECPDPCFRPCHYDYNPVCYKGQTYGNKCSAEIAHCKEGTGKKFKYTPGPCCDKPCHAIHRPVCYNGKTYSNKCLAEIAHCERNTGKKFVYTEGKCKIILL